MRTEREGACRGTRQRGFQGSQSSSSRRAGKPRPFADRSASPRVAPRLPCWSYRGADTRDESPSRFPQASPGFPRFPAAPRERSAALDGGSIPEAAWRDYKMLANIGQS